MNEAAIDAINEELEKVNHQILETVALVERSAVLLGELKETLRTLEEKRKELSV